MKTIPVALFAYARPTHLARVLACLRENRVPLIEAFADGAKGEADVVRVAEVRRMLRAVDWCEVRLCERERNVGLGKNILSGVTDVAARHPAFIVWEDDLICVPGTYDWMCAALTRYAQDERVMSVTPWTHARVTPPGVANAPYFDGRAECWVWGTWSRAWSGMEQPALEKLAVCASRGVAPDAYGADLPRMAAEEKARNIWAVRWLYHHLQHGGLCLRPPWSMVEHVGDDAQATNCPDSGWMRQPDLRNAPPLPATWPEPRVRDECRQLWQEITRPSWRERVKTWLRPIIGR